MLKLWGRISSINVQKAVWCLDEIGLAYERIDVGGPFGMSDVYRAMNPNGLVPTLEEPDGFTLWESNAIVRYLAARHPESGLYPADPRVRADADRWMDWQCTAATPMLRDAFWQLIRTPPAERDAAALARSVEGSARVATILDRHFADRRFVTGDTFTMGDIPITCHVNRWYRLDVARPELPNLLRYRDEVLARPGGRTVVATPLS